MTGDLFAPPTSTGRGGKRETSLASIYHAKKSGNDTRSVGLLKRQFQTQVERVIHDSRGQPGQQVRIRIACQGRVGCLTPKVVHENFSLRAKISPTFRH